MVAACHMLPKNRLFALEKPIISLFYGEDFAKSLAISTIFHGPTADHADHLLYKPDLILAQGKFV